MHTTAYVALTACNTISQTVTHACTIISDICCAKIQNLLQINTKYTLQKENTNCKNNSAKSLHESFNKYKDYILQYTKYVST